MSRQRRLLSASRLALCLLSVAAVTARAQPTRADSVRAPFWPVVESSGARLPCLAGSSADEILVLACRERCAPIPWQLDERDGYGRLALDGGPEPNGDDPAGLLDDNDEVLWMLADGGRPMRPEEMPDGAGCGVEMRARRGAFEGRAYAFRVPAPAPRSEARYVEYDAALDRMSGARVSVGFGASTPRFIAARGEDGRFRRNLLDRLKVRASARFLGLVPLGRDEDDILTELVAWKSGPIRVTRRQRQWVRLGWGLRSPIFRSDTFFYRDFGILPVRLRLNFRASFFFRAIEIQALLDFRDLDGWQILVADSSGPFLVGALGSRQTDRLNRTESDWFGLRGPDVTFVQRLEMGPTLASVRHRILVRDGPDGFGPEEVPGERPGIGYRLTRWTDVDRGEHWFASVNYALPPDQDVPSFVADLDTPLSVDVVPFPDDRGRSRASSPGVAPQRVVGYPPRSRNLRRAMER